MARLIVVYESHTGNTRRMAEAVGLLRSALVAQGVQVPGAGIRVKRTPDAEALKQCRELGRSVAQHLVEEAR